MLGKKNKPGPLAKKYLPLKRKPHPKPVYLVRDGDTVFKGQKKLERELGFNVRVLPPSRSMLMPLDYHFHNKVGLKVAAEEFRKNIKDESRTAFHKRLLRAYRSPKAKIDKVLGSMTKRVGELHKMKGKYTKYDKGGNSKST